MNAPPTDEVGGDAIIDLVGETNTMLSRRRSDVTAPTPAGQLDTMAAAGYLRVPCRVGGCPRTVPLSPGFAIDRTCWVHHHLVAPVSTGWS